MSLATAVPFVIGQWVCGPRFYGREAEITGLLEDRQRWLWVAGLRRIGKTSLLKQLDHLAGLAGSDAGTLPLFWDLQGVGGVEELGLTFTDALLDAEELLAGQGISLEEVEDGDVFASLEKLARALRGRGTGLLLLCDEADELMPLHRAVPGVVARLWQAVAAFEPVRVVLASSLRLCDVAAAEKGIEELVERFAAPRHLGVMTDDEARALLRQSQLPAAARPPFTDAAVDIIRDHCGNHPMLLQIVAKRYREVGDLENTFFQMEADRTVQHLLAVDFELLLPAERQILRSLAASPENGISDPAAVRRLLDLGLIRPGGSRGLMIPNRFLADWLRS
jgi:hypothetical protein